MRCIFKNKTTVISEPRIKAMTLTPSRRVGAPRAGLSNHSPFCSACWRELPIRSLLWTKIFKQAAPLIAAPHWASREIQLPFLDKGMNVAIHTLWQDLGRLAPFGFQTGSFYTMWNRERRELLPIKSLLRAIRRHHTYSPTWSRQVPLLLMRKLKLSSAICHKLHSQ